VKKDEQKAVEAPSLFDMPAPVGVSPTPHSNSNEEAEILAEMNQDEATEEDDEAFVAS
jgi:hypothetical protein